MKKYKRNTKGITLIALVITIIVLLILAAVTINALSGDNGILKRASEAKNSTGISQEEESVKVAVAEALTQGIGTVTTENLQKALTNNGLKGTLTGNGPWNYTGRYKSYVIEKSGNMTSSSLSENSSDKIVDISGNFAVAEDGTLWELESGVQGNRWEEINKKRKVDEIGKITKTYFGEQNSFVITENEELYTWENRKSETENETDQNNIVKITDVENVEKIYINDLYDYSVFAKTKTGDIYAWGDNYYGQLGIGNTENQSRPVKVTGISNVEELYMNESTCIFAKTKTGDIYAWGYNGSGQLGIGNTEEQSSPKKVTGLSDIEEIYINSSSTFAKTKTGDIYAWGENNYGQLGIGNTENQSSPKKVTGLSDIEEIYINSSSTFAKTKTGDIYAWGENDNGQLGIGNTENQSSPKKVTGLSNIEEIYAEGYSSSIFAKTKTGDIYAWGENNYGQLGIGNIENQSSPIKITEVSNVEKIYIENSSLYVKTLDGKIYVAGRNTDKNLGLKNYTQSDFFNENNRILEFICWNNIKGLYGSNQNINKIRFGYAYIGEKNISILTEDGKIYKYRFFVAT